MVRTILLVISGLYIFSAFSQTHFTATPNLLKDINTQLNNSDYDEFIEFKGKMYFSQTSASQGRELWVSDGTPGGTHILKDIYTGSDNSNPKFFRNMGSFFLFSATSEEYGTELWRSDGTDTGTYMVKDIHIGQGKGENASPNLMNVVNNKLFFTAYDDTAGRELWISDGTFNGTIRLSNIRPGLASTQFDHYGSDGTYFYFNAEHPSLGYELYISDGTPGGTKLLKDINLFGSSHPSYFIAFKNKIYFSAYTPSQGVEIWYTDGTDTGTQILKDLYPGSQGFGWVYPIVYKDYIYFDGLEPLPSKELYRTDGTDTGTYLIKDINVTSSSSPRYFVEYNGNLYFYAVTKNEGGELWRTDGTKDSTYMLKDIYPGSMSSSPTQLISTPLGVFFMGTNPVVGNELFITDGTAGGTKRLSDINPNGNSLQALNFRPFFYKNKLFFNAQDSSGALSMYVSDGTPQGTEFFLHTNNGTRDANVARVFTDDSIMIFDAETYQTGAELYVTDGTSASTRLVEDFVAGPEGSEPNNMVSYNGSYFYSGITAEGNYSQLLRLSPPFNKIEAVYPYEQDTFPVDINDLTVHNGYIYFSGTTWNSGRELWRSDGTKSGTTIVKDLNPGSDDASPYSLAVFNGRLYFTADSADYSSELFSSDGTPGGTYSVHRINTSGNSAIFSDLREINGKLYFKASSPSGNNKLWCTDGTTSGTREVNSTVNVGYGLTVFKGNLYFAGDDGSGLQLCQSDGTDTGTKVLRVINGSGDADLGDFTVVGDKMFFLAFSDTFQQELFISDGTAGGTRIVKDFEPGSDHSYPYADIEGTMANKLYFTLYNDENGDELYETDGTEKNTRILTETKKGSAGSYPSMIGVANKRLLFESDHAQYGEELFYVAPELSVFSTANFPVADGSSFPSNIDSTYFENVPSGSELKRNYVLRNVGVDTVEITDIKVNGSADFTASTMQKSIVYGDSIVFPITYKPTGNSASATVEISWHYGIFGPYTYTFKVEGQTALNTDEQVKKHVRLMPNPVAAGEKLQVEVPIGTTSWSLFDVQGREVMRGATSERKVTLRIITPGIYYLIMDGNTPVPAEMVMVR